MFVERDGAWRFHCEDGVVLPIGAVVSIVFDRRAGILHAVGDAAELRAWAARAASLVIETHGVTTAAATIADWVQLEIPFDRRVAIVINAAIMGRLQAELRKVVSALDGLPPDQGKLSARMVATGMASPAYLAEASVIEIALRHLAGVEPKRIDLTSLIAAYVPPAPETASFCWKN